METPTSNERTWALVAHAAGPVGALASAGLLGFLAPLVIWLAKKDESAFVGDQACEAVNFQLTMFLASLAAVAFAVVTLGLGLLVALPVLLGIWVLEVVLGLVAALRANEGRRYRYPLTLRLLS